MCYPTYFWPMPYTRLIIEMISTLFIIPFAARTSAAYHKQQPHWSIP